MPSGLQLKGWETKMSFDALAEKIANKDEKAFEAVYEKMNKLVFSICYSIVKSQSVASDISQDTFVAVWSYAEGFKGNGFKAWILTIARNKALNYLEKQKREINIDFTESEDYTPTDEGEIDAETKITLHDALNKLDTKDRQIVLLKNSGMKMKEIAEYLNMPRGTASWRYKEAINKLKKYMEGEG